MRTLASQMRDEESLAEIDFPLNPYATYLFIYFPESLIHTWRKIRLC